MTPPTEHSHPDQLDWAQEHLPMMANLWSWGAGVSLLLMVLIFALLGLERISKNPRLTVAVVLVGALWLLSLVFGVFVITVVTAAQLQEPMTHLLLSPQALWPAILSAILLYRLRGRHPLLYGITEVSVALGSLFIATRAATSTLGQLTTLVAGVYFLIRGLDNIDKGLPPRARHAWDRLFPKLPTPSTLKEGLAIKERLPMSAEIETQPDTLPPLSPAIMDDLANHIQNAIKTAAGASPGQPASDALKKLVAKRVPPKTLGRYDTLDDYHLVVWDEAMSILERIFAYPYTVGYRKHLASAPQDVRMAWQIHSHSLRGNELYIVQDRAKAFLTFLHAVASESGLVAIEQNKSFEKAFKKTFDRRLLERHEVTHAHARPSLTSRIINLQSAMARMSPEVRSPMAAEVFGATMPFLAKLQQLRGKPLTIAEIEQIQQDGADKEAREMLDLFGKAAMATLNITMPALASDPQLGDAARTETRGRSERSETTP